jgi:hypothetical protein
MSNCLSDRITTVDLQLKPWPEQRPEPQAVVRRNQVQRDPSATCPPSPPQSNGPNFAKTFRVGSQWERQDTWPSRPMRARASASLPIETREGGEMCWVLDLFGSGFELSF